MRFPYAVVTTRDLQVPRAGPQARSRRGTAGPPPGTRLPDAGALHAGRAVGGGPGACSDRLGTLLGVGPGNPPRPVPAASARPPARPPFHLPPARPAPPAALTAFFFCTILSIFLAMRTTSSSMAPAGLRRAQPVRDGEAGETGAETPAGREQGRPASPTRQAWPRPFL